MSRHILSDIDNKIPAQDLGESESCFVFSDEMRVALIKWIGQSSRNDRLKAGLTEREASLMERLFNMIQT